jgi:hypothetical protein
LEIRIIMIDLADNQLEAIMRVATPLPEGKCQEFLERVAGALAVVLQMRGQINDDDVAVAAQLALRSLTHNLASQNWSGKRFPTPSPRAAAPTRRAWRFAPPSTKLWNWAASVFADALAWSKGRYYFE